MKKKIISVALLTVLCSMVIGCQKENIVEPQYSVSEIGETRLIIYSVNGVTHSVVVHGEREWVDLLKRLMVMAQNGYRVSVRNGNAGLTETVAKETVVYTTTNIDEAEAWVKKMAELGYSVDVAFDPETGTYTCIATK